LLKFIECRRVVVVFSATGLLSVEMQAVGAKVEEKDIVLLKEALEAVIILVSY